MSSVKTIDLKYLIASKKAEINALTQKLADFELRNQHLLIPVNQEFDMGVDYSPQKFSEEYTRLKNLENDRIKSLVPYEATIKHSQIQIKGKKLELIQLENQLIQQQDEQEWLQNFKPHCERFKDGFIREIEQNFDIEINIHKKTQTRYQTELYEIKKYLESIGSELENETRYFTDKATLDQKRQCVLGLSSGQVTRLTYSQSLEYRERVNNILMPEIIQKIADIEQRKQAKIDNIESDVNFRKFIRARIDIESSANRLKVASENYLQALQDFQINSAVKLDIGNQKLLVVDLDIDDYVTVKATEFKFKGV